MPDSTHQEIKNYYQILDIKPKSSASKLLSKYFKGIKKALANDDAEAYKDCIAGFEILREEKVAEAYHRIYRKHILKRNLNFPTVTEKKLINAFHKKEKEAEEHVNSYKGDLPSYNGELLAWIFKFLLYDLSKIIFWGLSGVVFIGVALYVIFAFGNQPSIYGGLILLVVGYFALRSNFRNRVYK